MISYIASVAKKKYQCLQIPGGIKEHNFLSTVSELLFLEIFVAIFYVGFHTQLLMMRKEAILAQGVYVESQNNTLFPLTFPIT